MVPDRQDARDTEPSGVLTTDVAIKLSLLAVLAYWALTVIGPFLSILMWSAVLTVALYPVFDWLVTRTGNRRLAAALVTVPFLLVFLGPIVWLGTSFVTGITGLIKAFDAGELSLPPPIESVKQWPLVGERIYEMWDSAITNTKEFLVANAPHFKPAGLKLLGFAEGVGLGLLEFVIAIIIAGFLFSPAPHLVEALRAFAHRVLSERGEEMLGIAGATIRNVSRGVVGVALLQAVLGGIGMLVAGVPGAGFLTFLALVLAILQIGAGIVFVPVVIWAWMSLDTTVAILLTIWMVPVGLIDNLLRPIVMARGLTTPMPIIVIGVFGGTIAYGLVGLFFGPIILSVAWALWRAWLGENKPAA